MRPTTAALAALAGGTARQRGALLLAAAELITAHTEPERGKLLLGAAATLASIVLPRTIITSSLKEAAMPVPVRDTPLGRKLYEEGRHDGHVEGRREGEHDAAVRITVALLHRRFGDDPRIPALAADLAEPADEERIHRITAAVSLTDLG